MGTATILRHANGRPSWFATCDLIPARGEDVVGGCNWCGSKPLPPRRTAWCSDECARLYSENHYWQNARPARLRLDDYKCQRCGARAEGDSPKIDDFPYWQVWDNALKEFLAAGPKLEVDHIDPILRKRGVTPHGCMHHLDKLRTLCHPCHVIITNEQFGRAPSESQAVLL